MYFARGIYDKGDCILYATFLAMKATVCMTNIITEPSPIFYSSGEVGVIKLRSHLNQLQPIPKNCRNMATWSVSLVPSYSFIVLTHSAMAFAMAHLIVT